MLSEEVLAKVVAKAKELATHSWEYGTLAEALLELEDRDLSVYCKGSFPRDRFPWPKIRDAEGLKYASQYIRKDGSETLCEDSTGVADPASLGVPALLLGQHHPEYLLAAKLQTEYLLNTAPRYEGKVISHRKDVEEVWADFIYMVPPFLAMYAVSVDDYNIMERAVKECEVYRDILMGSDGIGLWRHIAGPHNADAGFWCTGNAWVAAGLTRVLATLRRWKLTSDGSELEEIIRLMLFDLIDRVVSADLHRHEEELLPNYLCSEDEEPWFRDVAGTALLASVVWRLMSMYPGHFHAHEGQYTEWAKLKSAAVFKCVDPETGIAKPAVNSLKHAQREPLVTGNPEAQAFVILLWAAIRDYND
jgi:hypothetical protein